MLVLAVLVAALGLAAAEQCCSIEDRNEVQALWQSIWSAENTGKRTIIGHQIFEE